MAWWLVDPSSDPGPRHAAASLDGQERTGFQIVSYMYTLAQDLLPGQDIGLDISAEYAMAKAMRGD